MQPFLAALKKRLYIVTLAMLLLGALFGLFWPDAARSVGLIGTIYINLLKLIVIPVLMCEVTLAVYSSAKSAPRLIVRAIALFVGMFVVSFCITALIVHLLKPGAGFSAPASHAQWGGELASPSLSSFLLGIFPSNLLTAIANNALLPCILFSVVCGAAAYQTKAARAAAVVQEFGGIFTKILSYIMYLTPVGVFSLVAVTTAEYGVSMLKTGLAYVLCAWGCCIVVGILVMLLPAWIFAGISPITYCKRVYRIWLVTLSTCSSAATLPSTIRVCNESFGIPRSITGLIVPLGCTIHMCGGAVSFCLLAMFTAQLSGLSIGLPLFLLMLLYATLINMAAPGVPGGGIVLGATYLSALGLPLTFMGMYSGVYRLLDMAYTSMNVTGDITANILLARLYGDALAPKEGD